LAYDMLRCSAESRRSLGVLGTSGCRAKCVELCC
jgi:hypothetical protein